MAATTYSQDYISSAYESQQINNDKSYIDFGNQNLNDKYIKFDDPKDTDFNSFESYVTGIGRKTSGFDFKYSKSLFQDVSFLECQMLMEKYRRIKDVSDLLKSRATSTTFGLTRIGEDDTCGLAVDPTTNRMSVNFNVVQPVLVNGSNIKMLSDATNIGAGHTSIIIGSEDDSEKTIPFRTINNISLIYKSTDGSPINLNLATSDQLKSNVEVLQSRIDEYGLRRCVFIAPQIEFGTDIVVDPNRSYYCMTVASTPATPLGTPMFGIDFSKVQIGTGTDQTMVKFMLELDVNVAGFRPVAANFPWTWKPSAPSSFESGSVTLIEVTSFYRYGQWNSYGRVLDQYVISPRS